MKEAYGLSSFGFLPLRLLKTEVGLHLTNGHPPFGAKPDDVFSSCDGINNRKLLHRHGNCIHFFYKHFVIVDTADYLADQLFIRHQVRVEFGPEFARPDTPYRVIFCKCRKRDVDAFLAAIGELPNKMLLCGQPDYLKFCEDLRRRLTACKENGGVVSGEIT